ncbi:MAG: YabP/YqfC family sporulation protein [Clostridia bacterium]|nr:YabP/YqfC family sporulation protein [Clostridia bacterium]
MDTTITLTNQTNLFLTGVEKVFNVCPNEIVLNIGGKKLFVYGSGMEVQRVDLENKILIVNGLVTCLKYAGQKQSFLKRVFK